MRRAGLGRGTGGVSIFGVVRGVLEEWSELERDLVKNLVVGVVLRVIGGVLSSVRTVEVGLLEFEERP